MSKYDNDLKKEASKVLYWMTLLVMTICNLVVAIILIPILIALKGIFVLVLLFILGLIFGMIFNHLLRDIRHLERKHHFFAAVFIPVMSVIDLFVSVSAANKLAVVVGINITQEPFLLSSVFVIGFLGPYIVASFGR